ncbi:MAG: hypothetical protein HQ581_10560 [Planctomycetes bacterium]|nr:hypothetical protein [Planctomycetota bacterium]
MRRLPLLILLGLMTALAGCFEDTIEVSGNVTLDGTALEDGKIRFEPADGKGPTAEAVIAAGRYKLELPPGKKKVKIEGWKTVGQERVTPDDPSSPMFDVKEDVVPPRYNRDSELTYDPKGSGSKDYELSTQ